MEMRKAKHAPEVSGKSFESLSETVSVLFSTLEAQLPGSAVFVTQSRSGDLNQRTPGSDTAKPPGARQGFISIPLELGDASVVGSLCAVRQHGRVFEHQDLQILSIMARLIAFEMDNNRQEQAHRNATARLEEQREQLSKVTEDLIAVGRVMQELTGADARRMVCKGICEVSGATSAQLLEPDGDGNLVSTASFGFDLPSLTLPIGGDASGAVVAYLSHQGYFIADATTNPAARGW